MGAIPAGKGQWHALRISSSICFGILYLSSLGEAAARRPDMRGWTGGLSMGSIKNLTARSLFSFSSLIELTVSGIDVRIAPVIGPAALRAVTGLGQSVRRVS